MKAVITLEFEGELADELDRRSHADIGQVLRDALGEFIAKRTPVNAYVEKRYNAGYAATERFQRDKVNNVIKRCALADVIKKGDVTLVLSDDSDGRLPPAWKVLP